MQNALGCHGDRGLLSSFVGWIAGNATPSFIEGQSLSEEVCSLKHQYYGLVLFISAAGFSVLTVFVVFLCL